MTSPTSPLAPKPAAYPHRGEGGILTSNRCRFRLAASYEAPLPQPGLPLREDEAGGGGQTGGGDMMCNVWYTIHDI